MRQKRFSLLIILVFVLFGLFALLVYRSHFMSASTPEPITSWKTYTNDKLGFTISYPSNWVIITDSDRVVGWSTFIANNKDKLLATESLQVNIENSNIFEIPWSNGKKVAITKDNLGYYAYIGNTPATSIFQGRTSIKSIDSSPQIGAHTSLKILDGKRLVEVKVDTKDDKDIVLHDQIISTFKFTR